jgi:hypothetical protein
MFAKFKSGGLLIAIALFDSFAVKVFNRSWYLYIYYKIKAPLFRARGLYFITEKLKRIPIFIAYKPIPFCRKI